MQVHDGIVVALVSIDHRICVEANNQVVTQLGHLLQKVQVSNVEQVKGTGHVDNLVTGLGLSAVGELEDLLGGWNELGHPSPR